jgi:hypothetical protein
LEIDSFAGGGIAFETCSFVTTEVSVFETGSFGADTTSVLKQAQVLVH